MNTDYKAGFESGYNTALQNADEEQIAQYEEFLTISQSVQDLARDKLIAHAGLFDYLTHIDNDGFHYRSKTDMLIVHFKAGVIILLPNKVLEIVYTGK